MCFQNRINKTIMSKDTLSIDSKSGYLSKNTCQCLKGIFSILVLMHHLSQCTSIINGIEILQYFFSQIGHLSVSVFFFLSGYGLIVSLKKNEDKYIKHFFKHKIVPFYCIEVLLIILYSFYLLFLEKNFSFNTFIKSFLFGDTVIIFGWYLQVQLMFYLYFYLVFKFVKSKQSRYIYLLLLIVIQYITLFLLDFGNWWYISCPSFLLGFFWAEHQSVINKITAYKWSKALIFSLILLLLMAIFNKIMLTSFMQPLIVVLFDLSFVIFIILFISRINIVSPLTRWLGKYSFEIYITQGFFLTDYYVNAINVKNDYLYCLIAILSCLIASVIFHPIIQRIYTFARK